MNRLLFKIKENRGSGELIGAIFAMLLIAISIIVGIAGFKLINQQMTLSSFGNQLIRTVGQEGCTNDDRITARFAELSDSTGLSPSVSYDATYIAGSGTKVQYGDTIKMILTLDTKISAVGISIPVTLTVTKSAQSEIYWK